MWQHIAIVAVGQVLDHAAGGAVVVRPGATGLSFAWVALALTLLDFLGVVLLALSIKALDSLPVD